MTATQIAHPWRTVARTVAWYVLAVLGALAAAGPILSETLGAQLPASWLAVAAQVSAIAGAVLAAVQRIALLPSVAAIIERTRLRTGATDGDT